MRYPIDLAFLDEDGLIVGCARLAPTGVAGCRGARHVLEMRAGEIERLGLRVGQRPELVPATPIYAATIDATSTGRFSVALAAALLGCPMGQGTSHAASSGAAAVTAGAVMAPLNLAQPLSEPTLQRLEDEAEARYRAPQPEQGQAGSRAPGNDAELVRLYESLAELATERSSHAWLRIGNIHQRSGAIGAAIDAYRRLLDPGVADAAVPPGSGATAAANDTEARAAERKALLNLAGLALDQARRSLIRLQALDGSAVAATPFSRDLESLEGQFARRHAQAPELAAETAARGTPVSSEPAPYTVERYTASARRNAVKSARGSLHVDPADALPARPVPKPRSRPASAALPSVEYLLGDPNRSKQVDGGASAGRGGGPIDKRRGAGR
jgi:hypothetical protein